MGNFFPYPCHTYVKAEKNFPTKNLVVYKYINFGVIKIINYEYFIMHRWKKKKNPFFMQTGYLNFFYYPYMYTYFGNFSRLVRKLL